MKIQNATGHKVESSFSDSQIAELRAIFQQFIAEEEFNLEFDISDIVEAVEIAMKKGANPKA